MEKLRKYRKKGGFTQKQVAEKLKVSRTTVTKWATVSAFFLFCNSHEQYL